ncbi:MAG: lipid carrier--UDP-N-acetylgalactosaminyltransferase [Piscirickettsiaceae bacterium]|nr:MAG: lipid carrier--UDP-N-acetylgalactosaminyltransferase [Piscirickettsiaceae bacterium]
MKRLFDIVVSLIAMIVLAPVLVPIMIILRFSGEGKIFYLQERVGQDNERFFITKFATMLEDSPNIGSGEHTLQNDPRVLPFGKILRKSKINELPQIWDIFVGKMSWVGPRPTTPSHHALYPEYYHKVMEDHVPGLTGIGSIIFRDEESILSRADDYEITYSQEIVPYKAELELWYKENRNFGMDIILILLTAWAVIKPKNGLLFKLYPNVPYLNLENIGENSNL